MPPASLSPANIPHPWPDAGRLVQLSAGARKTSARLRLCLRQSNWRGAAGNWTGAGIGSSIDFQDHRAYQHGDDPRYIDWPAYARTGQTIMKLYREEVSPRIDVMVDLSRSMTGTFDRLERAIELALFCVESAAACGAGLRVYAVQGESWSPIETAALRAAHWPAPDAVAAANAPRLESIPLARGSLRILISDLLYPDPPAGTTRTLAGGHGRAVILMPWRLTEADPAWDGNHEFIDVESGASRRQRVTHDLLDRYRAAYRNHIEGWRQASRRVNARLARVPCAGTLSESLLGEALEQGVVEAWI